MPEKGSVYSNAQSIEALRNAFQGTITRVVTIPPRESQDVPKFIQRLQAAKEATRKHSTRFG